ncbi:ATP-binding protein [Microbacterium sp. dk485]|uniref:sensor histidine kinase n=1 Tax=Microbacterium sp. dk485 TaxID=2560021 RepID=UPI001FD83481|nr:ATP-binding protein [Microbacterium sp. dk485]
MTAIIGMVAVILAIIALSTAAILGQVLQENLDTNVRKAAEDVRLNPQSTAQEVLTTGRFGDGTLLVTRTAGGGTTGAYVDDGTVRVLDRSQISDILESVGGATSYTVELAALGDYRVATLEGRQVLAIIGLPLTEITGTLSQILATVVIVTTGGLLLLSAIIAVVIRIGLGPLRAVADTATRVAKVRMDSGDVSITERVPADQADESTEIGQVGAALNTLLDHVDASLTARQRNEELMRSFVADASHELRTPLTSIRGYSELSLRDPSLTPGIQAALERIQAQSLRMTALVEDLLLLARLDEGTELVYDEVDLTRLAIEAVEDARPAGPDHRWVLDVDDEPVTLAGDAARLRQVADNLLANARTHTPAGTVVTVSVRREGEEGVLSVHDDGPGVDPAVADRLFERFSRGDVSRARQTGGTGLGLSIARAIVAAHDGTIGVRSTPGDTTFEVRLPLRHAGSA